MLFLVFRLGLLDLVAARSIKLTWSEINNNNIVLLELMYGRYVESSWVDVCLHADCQHPRSTPSLKQGKCCECKLNRQERSLQMLAPRFIRLFFQKCPTVRRGNRAEQGGTQKLARNLASFERLPID